jgi:hypothetical protein
MEEGMSKYCKMRLDRMRIRVVGYHNGYLEKGSTGKA